MGVVRTPEIGIVHGRFQPFHKEHLDYVLAASRLADKVVVGLVSPSIFASGDGVRFALASNPLTYFERVEMISAVLFAHGITPDRLLFVPFPIDAPDRLHHFVPAGAVNYMTINDAWGEGKKTLLRAHGYDVQVLWERPQQISGRAIRRRIADGDPLWRGMVPDNTAEYLERHDLLSRIAQLVQRE
jgi:cytidyltransferase-like protein